MYNFYRVLYMCNGQNCSLEFKNKLYSYKLYIINSLFLNLFECRGANVLPHSVSPDGEINKVYPVIKK